MVFKKITRDLRKFVRSEFKDGNYESYESFISQSGYFEIPNPIPPSLLILIEYLDRKKGNQSKHLVDSVEYAMAMRLAKKVHDIMNKFSIVVLR